MKLKSKWNSKTAPPPKTEHIIILANDLQTPVVIALELYYLFGPTVYNTKSRTFQKQGQGVARGYEELEAEFTSRFGPLNPAQARAIRTAAAQSLATISRKGIRPYAGALMAMSLLRRDDELHEQVKLLGGLRRQDQPSIIGAL